MTTVSGSSDALPGTEAGLVKVTALAEYPGKGRGTGGVRCHRFLKGEDTLIVAGVSRGSAEGGRSQRRPRRPARGARSPRRLRYACRAADRRHRRAVARVMHR